MAKIAVLLDDLFEDAEYSEPAKAFAAAGHELVHVGLKAGVEVRGETHGTSVYIDQAVQDVSSEIFDALFIPGGYSPDRLRANGMAVALVREFVHSGKPVFAICHAPQLLITAQVLQGRKVTGYKSVIQDIKNAGAQYLDREVVEDDNLISSRSSRDIPAFVQASLAKLQAPTARHRSGSSTAGFPLF